VAPLYGYLPTNELACATLTSEQTFMSADELPPELEEFVWPGEESAVLVELPAELDPADAWVVAAVFETELLDDEPLPHAVADVTTTSIMLTVMVANFVGTRIVSPGHF
jgi:hypothetical protein